MKFTFVKKLSLAVLLGALLAGSSVQIDACPLEEQEYQLFYDGFYEVKTEDTRTFVEVVDEFIRLLESDKEFFQSAMHKRSGKTEYNVQDFINMLKELKKETKAMSIVNKIKKYRSCMPLQAQELISTTAGKLWLLKGLKDRLGKPVHHHAAQAA